MRHAEVTLRLSSDAAIPHLEAALRSLPLKSIGAERRDRIRVTAVTHRTWKSWGETLVAEVAELSGGSSHVRIESRPLVATTLLDYGKNRENVERCVAELRTVAQA